MSNKPLEILPWGRTREQQEALERKREAGRGGLRGCLAMMIGVACVIFYVTGYVAGMLTGQ